MHKLRIYISYKNPHFFKDFFFHSKELVIGGRKACLNGRSVRGQEEPIAGRPLLKPIEHLGVGYSYSKPVAGR